MRYKKRGEKTGKDENSKWIIWTMQESSSDQAEEAEAVDDPTWSSSDVREAADEEEDQDEEEDTEPLAKKRRVRSKKTKLSKCPHCFREFTNLKHHINQQHSQVWEWATFIKLFFSVSPKSRSPSFLGGLCWYLLIFLTFFQLKKYKCAACGYSCYLKTDLERHITNVRICTLLFSWYMVQ